MKGPPPMPGGPKPPPAPNPPPMRPGPPKRWTRPGTVVVVVDVASEAVTAALAGVVGPEDVAACANAVAPTATPAAAPTPTANFNIRRRGRTSSDCGARSHGGPWSAEGVPGVWCIDQPLRLVGSGA